MKSKHEQAQALLEGLEQVDERMLQQALATDTREKFRALGKLKQRKTGKERPASALRRWGGVAACLVLILALAVSPWFFSSLLPVITPTEPTEPTIPPTTTETTEPTEPTEPEVPCPNLLITGGDETITAYMVCGNWNYVWFDSRSPAELLQLGRMPWLTTELFAFLEFEIEPNSFEVQCWPADQEITTQGEEVTVTDGMLQLKEGGYVYEVTASWYNHGRITYVFAVTASCSDTGQEFTSDSGEYLWPSMLYDQVTAQTLNVTNEDGAFVCFTDSTTQAKQFVTHQQMLLQFLREQGMDIKALTYYAVDYGDCFSRSDHQEAYIDWSAVGTWQQILVTLQAMWGDYTDYGYVYVTANAIAEALNWERDSYVDLGGVTRNRFFQENPEAIELLYPSFSPKYATDETIRACKVLSHDLYRENFQLERFELLQKPIAQQLDAWHSLLSAYAQQIGMSYTRQDVSYAYCSARIPLKIKAANAEFYIDAGYADDNGLFLDAFSNYVAIYETARIMHSDILSSAVYWHPSDDSTVPIYFLSEETAKKRFSDRFTVRYVEPQYGEAVYTRYLSLYMYGYYKHIVYQWNPDLGQAWQAQAFCELGRSKTWFAQKVSEAAFTTNEEKAKLFYACTGRNYKMGRDDFFEMMDISCYINEEYTPRYTPVDAAASIGWYLLQQYGEENIHQLLLFPDQCQSITGKTWEELTSEWAQYIKDKYSNVVLPENLGS